MSMPIKTIAVGTFFLIFAGQAASQAQRSGYDGPEQRPLGERCLAGARQQEVDEN